MDSKEILRQYIMGAMQSESAVAELEKNIAKAAAVEDLQAAARSRYVIGFIRRDLQYKRGLASEKDLCLNIRDIILFLGRMKLTEKQYEIVCRHSTEFDLVCESDCQVSCILHSPEWLKPEKYVKEVYAFKYDRDLEMEVRSAGDSILRDHTIFKSYRSFEQKIAVHTALNLPGGYTLLVSQPTGGGKSLITQLLASTSLGLTLVIVPTVALAMDQYHAAVKNLTDSQGIYFYRGGQTPVERGRIIRSLKKSEVRMLFTSPEAILKNAELRSELEKAAKSQYLANIVVDEAHMVPDWGVFFRPDFQLFSILLKRWRHNSDNSIRTYLLSATLSEDVVDTLFSLFGTEGKNAQVRCDALRQEPRFYFCPVHSRKEQIEKTLEAIKLLPKPMIVYVLEPREARELQKILRSEGYFNIPIFTGETGDDDRDAILVGWKQQEFDVVIATSAFGIGVDKSDVRTILHACCPENLSRFYQEVGRGGRDHLPSISLLMPYQSQHDSKGDVHRALGLVNKRVLTVEKAMVRWKSMLAHTSAFVDFDECTLDTTATPYTMTEEEVKYAGNQNAAWNVNLLLLLHRVGLIDLVNVDYVSDNSAMPPRKYYSVSVKLLKPDVFGDEELLKQELAPLRAQEYEAQMEGYRIMRSLAASPRSMCWGRVFKRLFPLARVVCNGCPADPDGRVTTDERYKLRKDPEIILPPSCPSKRLNRNMGSFDQMIVRRNVNGACTSREAEDIARKGTENGIGVIVIPHRFENKVMFRGLVLNYEEFYFAVPHCPYLFASGVLCMFDNDAAENFTLYKNLERLEKYSYRRILYCNENTLVTRDGKIVRDKNEGYTISIERF